MKLRTTLVMFAGLLAAACATAQTADGILERNFAALGGKAKIRAIRSLRLEATQQQGAKSVPIRLLWKRPNRLRIESPYEGVEAVQVFDGARGWYTYPGLPGFETQDLDGASLDALRAQADLVEGPTFDYAAKGNKVELLGRDKLAEGEAWRLLLTTAQGDVRTLWFDAHSMLEVREERREQRADKEVTIVSSLSDFRAVGGVRFAHRVEDRVQGTEELSVFTIQKLELDVDLPDALFVAPAAPAAPQAPGPAHS